MKQSTRDTTWNIVARKRKKMKNLSWKHFSGTGVILTWREDNYVRLVSLRFMNVGDAGQKCQARGVSVSVVSHRDPPPLPLFPHVQDSLRNEGNGVGNGGNTTPHWGHHCLFDLFLPDSMKLLENVSISGGGKVPINTHCMQLSFKTYFCRMDGSCKTSYLFLSCLNLDLCL